MSDFIRKFLPLSNTKIDLTNNSFDFIRLFFAILVVYTHSLPYGFGMGSESIKIHDMHNELSFGSFAVYGFFVISGFLITSSILRSNNLIDFFGKRFIRIMPGFWVCLLITAFIISPILYYINHFNFFNYFSEFGIDAYNYFWNNSTLEIKTVNIGDILNKSKFNKLNDPLWSLIFEVRAYILLAIFWMFGIFKNRFLILLPAAFFWFSYYGVTFIPGFRELFSTWVGDWKIASLFSYFFVASAFYIWRDKLIMDWKFFILAVVNNIYFISIDRFAAIAPMTVTYSILYIATVLPFKNLSKKIGDLSYGVYIYSAPIQMVLTSYGLSTYGYWPYVIVSISLSLIAGFLSWNLVEKRFLVRAITVNPESKPVI